MSGLGKRFKDASYSTPKPLITVMGKPIIAHMVAMFQGDHEFIFICNKQHLAETAMSEIILSIAPLARIIMIDTHDKGPVYATSFAIPYIEDHEDVLISYCDYAMEFDLVDMIKKVNEGNFVGAVPSYTGFHPHLLHKKLYGGILTNGNGLMLDYKEKHSFTEDPSDCHHSAGAYYFRRGEDLKKYHKQLTTSDIMINGEQYTSMLYYLCLKDGEKVYVPEVSRFMQWGTPEDFEEFEAWYRYFSKKFNLLKLETYIPKEREHFILPLYDEKSPLFNKCYTYWESYFIR